MGWTAVCAVGEAVASVVAAAGLEGAVATIAIGAIDGALIGGAVGGIKSAVTGGNILDGIGSGMLGGAVTGGIFAGAGAAWDGLTAAADTGSSVAGSTADFASNVAGDQSAFTNLSNVANYGPEGSLGNVSLGTVGSGGFDASGNSLANVVSDTGDVNLFGGSAGPAPSLSGTNDPNGSFTIGSNVVNPDGQVNMNVATNGTGSASFGTDNALDPNGIPKALDQNGNPTSGNGYQDPGSNFNLPSGGSTATDSKTPKATSGGIQFGPSMGSAAVQGAFGLISGMATTAGAADAKATQNKWDASQKVITPISNAPAAQARIQGRPFVDAAQIASAAANPAMMGVMYKNLNPAPAAGAAA